MKIREIKNASNQELLSWLIGSAMRDHVTKQEAKIADRICTELLTREIIDDADALYDTWRG